MELGTIREDWNVACIILAYKRRGGSGECANYIEVSILSKISKRI